MKNNVLSKKSQRVVDTTWDQVTFFLTLLVILATIVGVGYGIYSYGQESTKSYCGRGNV